jgi:hypothetical protein
MQIDAKGIENIFMKYGAEKRTPKTQRPERTSFHSSWELAKRISVWNVIQKDHL